MCVRVLSVQCVCVSIAKCGGSVESRVEYAYFDLGWQSFALSVRVRLYHVGVGQKRSGACAGADRRPPPPPLRCRPAAAVTLSHPSDDKAIGRG